MRYDGQLATAVALSLNSKLGNAATTHAAQISCPDICVFKDGGGCYAESGSQGKFVTAPLNQAAVEFDATELDVALAEAAAIDALEVAPGRPMRLHTVGDCSSDETARIVSGAAQRYTQRGGGPVWTYCHSWRDVARSSWGTVSVLASCETAEDVAAAHARGYATAIVVEEFESDRRHKIEGWPSHTPPGSALDALPCPSMTRGVHCSDCRLCFDDAGLLERGYSIAFEVHGVPFAKRQAKKSLRDPDDETRKQPSLERIRAIREHILATEGREPTGADVAAIIPDLHLSSIRQWLRYLRGDIPHPIEIRTRARSRKQPTLTFRADPS